MLCNSAGNSPPSGESESGGEALTDMLNSLSSFEETEWKLYRKRHLNSVLQEVLLSDPNVFQSYKLQDENQSLAYTLEKDEISEMRGVLSVLLKNESPHTCISQYDISDTPYVLKHLVAIKCKKYEQNPV